jgi:hypothetical protein
MSGGVRTPEVSGRVRGHMSGVSEDICPSVRSTCMSEDICPVCPVLDAYGCPKCPKVSEGVRRYVRTSDARCQSQVYIFRPETFAL